MTNKNKVISTFLVAITAAAFAAVAVAGPADDFNELAARGDATGQEWFELAISAREQSDADTASKALERATAAGFSPIRVSVERSRQLIVADRAAEAVGELRAVFDQGFTVVSVLTGDPVINSIAGMPAYDTLIAEMTVQAFPCTADKGFADFDFWLGEWDVHLADGSEAGSNVITRDERGCVLIERWTSATGGTGMSINYVDRITDEWVQVWNAAGGSQINIRGGLTDEGMAMEGTIHYVANGTTAPFRALWTPLEDGRVRQYFEQSNDGGETWFAWFEGFYTRRSE